MNIISFQHDLADKKAVVDLVFSNGGKMHVVEQSFPSGIHVSVKYDSPDGHVATASYGTTMVERWWTSDFTLSDPEHIEVLRLANDRLGYDGDLRIPAEEDVESDF